VVLVIVTGCGWLRRAPDLGPEAVVEKFYRWYIGYPGNPLADREYRLSPYLSEAYVREVDDLLASFDRGGFDPFLLAQDIPRDFEVGSASVSGDTATVTVGLYFGGEGATPVEREVSLRLIDGAWRITAISLNS
jgi:hypothetical protein